MKKYGVTVATLFILSTSMMYAQTTQFLSIEKAIQLGMENSKVLQMSVTKQNIAEARYGETMDMLLPSVKLNMGYTRLSDVPPLVFAFPGSEPYTLVTSYENNYASSVSAREVIFSGFRLKYARASAGFIRKAAGIDVENDKDEVALNIVHAYFNLYKLYQTQLIIDQNLEQVRAHVTESEKWEQNGIVTHNDVVRWRLQESNILLSKLDIENSIRTTNYNFNILLGLPVETLLQIDTTDVNTLVTITSLDDYQQLAATSRSDLQSIDLKNKAAANNLKVAKNSYYPQLSLLADFNYSNPNPRYFPQIGVFKSSWDAGVALNFDVTNLFSNRHFVSENNALLLQGNILHAQMTDKIKSEVFQSYLNYTQSLDKLKVLQLAVEQAKDNYELMDSRYKNTVALLSDLIDAQTLLFQSEINLVIGKSDTKIAYYQLLKSTGTIQ